MEREQRASGNCSDVFGSASSAIAAHGTPTAAFHPTRASPSNNQLPTLSELESHLDNMAMAVTNEKAMLDSLITSNATLTKITADKLTKLEKLVLDLKPSAHRSTQSVQLPPTSADSRGLSQLRAAIKHKWIPGGFCSTHGLGVSAGHSRADCKGKRPDHIDFATRTNPQGPVTPHCLHTQPLDCASPWSTVPNAYTAPQPPSTSPFLSLSSNSNPYRCLAAPASPPRKSAAQILNTAILDSGTSDIYLAPDAPVTNVNPSAPTSTVTDATGAHHHSSTHADHLLPTLPACSGKIMPSFKHTLFRVGPLCNNGCRVLFDSVCVTIYNKTDDSIVLQGWRKPTGAKLWRFPLLPDNNPSHHVPLPTSTDTPSALNATNLPSVGALVHYLHAAAGFPVKSTWLATIQAGNYASWPGLTYANATCHCPDSTETIKGHLTQMRKGIRSTKPKSTHPPPVPSPSTFPSPTPSHELHIVIEPIRSSTRTTWAVSPPALAAVTNTSCWPTTHPSRNRPRLPNYLWDKLLPQTKLTLNLLRQSPLAPAISAWEAFNGTLSYDATPLGPMGAPSSSTTKPQPENPGTSVATTASVLDQPYTTTAASKLWTPPPTVLSSLTQLNSATAISTNQPSPMMTASSMQSTTSPLPLQTHPPCPDLATPSHYRPLQSLCQMGHHVNSQPT
eukprot:CCRYP_015405-RA/>CCRYP_015405-RA protein AED:0.48 eAED:0.22 QI:0/0/0/0.66/1/1/3/0/674